MHRRLILSFLIVLTTMAGRLFAQNTDSGVEIRLALIQGIGNGSIKNMALGISVINHTGSDIYIPGLKMMPFFASIDMYREENGKFVQTDIFGIDHTIHESIVPDTSSPLEDFYYKKIPLENHRQDSLILVYCHNNHLSPSEWTKPGNQPLFLKAGQHLDNFEVINIDHTWKHAGRYKIVFEPKSVDPAYSPVEILRYRCFPKALVKANVLYFTTINYDQIDKN